MSYFRSITYIDYYENGSKCGNIGHVRWEIRDEECKISIYIQGTLFDRIYRQAERRKDKLSMTASFLQGDVDTGYQSRKVALMELKESKLQKVLRFHKDNMAGLSFDRISGIHFAIEDKKYGVTVLDGNTERVALAGLDSGPAVENGFAVESHPGQKAELEAASAATEEINNNDFSMDKWEQLCRMYPKVHPLRNENSYISISPKDFVIFPNEYQKLVHNSFLLHGFYNYQHIILGKYGEEFYLGVPGTYHDREALVANMFGFNGFESVDKRETGTFGYYMTKVCI